MPGTWARRVAAAGERDPHADLDLASRTDKARKIIHLLRERVALEGSTALEVGTGSGVIAGVLKAEVGGDGEVWAVDTVDQRIDSDAVSFRLVSDTKLPFSDGTFDLVISNHVIEHVGDSDAQDDHVRELARVLRPGGWLYLAMPNRWAPVEPHFKLPLLSWLPVSRRSAYVRAARRGPAYDCRPLSRAELERLLDLHGFEHTEVSRDAVAAMRDIEGSSASVGFLLRLAPVLYPLARPVLPSLVYLGRRSA